MADATTLRLGTAAWAIPRASAGAFPPGDSVLARYAGMFDAVEINSTFYRSHQRRTYERWAATVPTVFRFAVKVPRTISHLARLKDCNALIDAFAEDVAALGAKLGPLLLQLPPSLAFDPDTVEAACRRLARAGQVVCEPRHASWFTPEIERWLGERQVVRVAADPPHGAHGERPGGWTGLAYYRLHGSPRVYYSPYATEMLEALAARLAEPEAATRTWCVFDNTALGAATADALTLRRMLSRR